MLQVLFYDLCIFANGTRYLYTLMLYERKYIVFSNRWPPISSQTYQLLFIVCTLIQYFTLFFINKIATKHGDRYAWIGFCFRFIQFSFFFACLSAWKLWKVFCCLQFLSLVIIIVVVISNAISYVILLWIGWSKKKTSTKCYPKYWWCRFM